MSDKLFFVLATLVYGGAMFCAFGVIKIMKNKQKKSSDVYKKSKN